MGYIPCGQSKGIYCVRRPTTPLMPQGKGQETKGQGQRLHPTPTFLSLPNR